MSTDRVTVAELLDHARHLTAQRHADALGVPLRVITADTPPGPRAGHTPTHVIVDEPFHLTDDQAAAYARAFADGTAEWAAHMRQIAEQLAPALDAWRAHLAAWHEHLVDHGLVEPAPDPERPPMLAALDAKCARTTGPPPRPLDGRGRRR